ncbi:MAG: vacuolar protein sorting-associated family 26 protein [Anaerolineae bacterium]
MRQQSTATRQGLVYGAALATLALLLLGGLFGWVNRGMVGAAIGAASGALCGFVLGALIGAVVGSVSSPRKDEVLLSISLDRSDARYSPGETVSGRVTLSCRRNLNVSGGKVYLVGRGFYAYDKVNGTGSQSPEFVREARDYVVLENDLITAGSIRRGAPHTYTFRFTVPDDAQPTHQGHICHLRWSIHVALEAPDIPTVEAQREVLVEAAPPEMPTSPVGYQSTSATQVCQLVLELPQAVYAQGDTVKARAYIMPTENFEADEVRAVMLRIENTPSGEDHIVYVSHWDAAAGRFRGESRSGGNGTTYVWLEGEDYLCGPCQFKVAQPVSYAIELGVPAEWRPTLWTEDGHVTWKLAAVIARSNKPDIRALHEVIVYTAAVGEVDPEAQRAPMEPVRV